jgi:hypothetical protein
MNWKNLTVAHYQALYPISRDKELTDEDRSVKIISALYGLTEAQIDDLPMKEFKSMLRESNFLLDPIPSVKPVKYLSGKKRKYKILYDINDLPFARYAEIKTFRGSTEEDLILNLHKIVTSMVMPVKFFKVQKYNAANHADYASDIQDAKFIDVFNICVFFCHLFAASIASTRDYFIRGIMMTTNATTEQAETEYTNLLNGLAGFITLHKLPNMKESTLKQLGIYELLKPSTH